MISQSSRKYFSPFYKSTFPGGIQTFCHYLADEGCYLFSLLALSYKIIPNPPGILETALFAWEKEWLFSKGNGNLSCEGSETKVLKFLTQKDFSLTRIHDRDEIEAELSKPFDYKTFYIGRFEFIPKERKIRHYCFIDPLAGPIDSLISNRFSAQGTLVSLHKYTLVGV